MRVMESGIENEQYWSAVAVSCVFGYREKPCKLSEMGNKMRIGKITKNMAGIECANINP